MPFSSDSNRRLSILLSTKLWVIGILCHIVLTPATSLAQLINEPAPLELNVQDLVLDEAPQQSANQTSSSNRTTALEESPAVVELIHEAKRLEASRRWTEAVGVYQQIIDDYPYKVIPYDQGYIDALLWVERELRANATLLQTYRRTYEPQAQRQLAEAQQSASPWALDNVIRRYRLSPSSLEASLSLAGDCLEQGNLIDAAGVLDQAAAHPDLASQIGRWHELQAAVGLFDRQPDRLETHRKALSQLNELDRLARLDDWSKRLQPPASAPGWITPTPSLDETPLKTLGDALWRPGLPVAPTTGNAMLVNIQRRAAHPALRNSRFPISPMLDEQWLYINDNVSVLAYDRISGQLAKRYDLTANDSQDPNVIKQRIMIRRGDVEVMAPQQQRSVLLTDDRLFAVLGRSADSTGVFFGGAPEQEDVRLVCLNRQTFKLNWSVTPEQLDETLSRSFFHGTPIVGPGRIYALIRRARNGWCHSFLVAVDSRTGRLLWRRYVAGSPVLRSEGPPPYAQVLAGDDRLYVVDNLGTVSCRDGRTGRALWIILPPRRAKAGPSMLRTSLQSSSGQNGPPVLTAAGLIVSNVTGDHPLLLDPQTGRMIHTLSVGPIQEATHLLALDGDVLCIGRNVSRVDGSTLRVKWSRPMATAAAVDIGQPALTSHAVWIAVGHRLQAFQLADGRAIVNEQLQEPGNVVVEGQQIIVASDKTVQTYMDWPVAHKALIRQIQQHPLDPTRGLALAQLGAGVDRHEAVLPGVDHALQAIDRFSQAHPQKDQQRLAMQENVFRYIRHFAQTAPQSQGRRALFDRMAQLAETPWRQVQHLLDHGAFLVQTDQPAQAVHRYQVILDSPILINEYYEHPQQGSRLAGSEARHRLRELLTADPTLYHSFDLKAAERLAQLTDGERVDAQQLTALARQYPFSRWAGRARFLAAQSLASDGQITSAISQWRQAYLETHDDDLELAQQVVSRLVWALELQGKPRLADRWLTKAQQRFAVLALQRENQPIDIEAWRSQLALQKPSTPPPPGFALPVGEPIALPGRLLTPTHQPPADWPHGALITLHDRQLQYRSGEQLDVQWEILLDDSQVQLLSLTREHALLWFANSGRLSLRHVRDGRRAWRDDVLINEHLNRLTPSPDAREEPLQNPQQLRAQKIRQRLIEQLQAQAMQDLQRGEKIMGASPAIMNIAMTDASIIAADWRGRLAGVDRLTGQVAWTQRLALTQLTGIRANDERVVVMGRAELDGVALRAKAMVLDAETGRLQAQPATLPDHTTFSWLALGGPGFVLEAGDRLIAYNDAVEPVWEFPITPGPIVGPDRIEGELLLVTDASGSLLALDAHTGVPAASRISVREGAPARDRLQWVDPLHHVLTPEQVFALDREGALAWRDSVADNPKNLFAQLVSDPYLIAIAAEDEQRIVFPHPARLFVRPRGPQTYRLYFFDRLTGRLAHEQTMTDLSKPIAAAVMLHDRVVLSTANRTLIIPTAHASPAP